jgi:PST family polysaccharide transporter
MSLAQKAARGALWTIVSSMGGRAVGLIGTVLITRFLDADEMGEVADATIVAMVANWVSIWGFGQYAVVKGRGPEAHEATWHATVAYFVVGAVALGLMALFGGRVMPLINAPNAAAYVPGMALALFIKRFAAIPERVLTRQMNFRASGMALAIGEAVYTIAALGFAVLGMGGWSIVYGNIVQSSVVALILVTAAGRAAFTPTKLSKARFRDMLRYGVPLGIQNMAAQAARYLDKPVISYFFGTTSVGAYNLAYNVADVPAIQVGEQIALVLMPSMAELPASRRPEALERSAALLSLIVFPLAVGLGLVAYPLIDLALPHNEWQEVAPLLVVLACLSIFRPVTWVLSAYLEAESKTNRLMLLELGKLAVLLGGIAALHGFGVRVAAGAVGLAFGATAVAGVLTVAREGASVRRLLTGFLQPATACAVMAVAVLGVHWLLDAAGIHHSGVHLPAMIAAGAVAYVAAALIIARDSSRDLLRLVKKALKRS